MKTKPPPIPQTQVLDWLQTNHPNLHTTAEIEKAWVWITENLQGTHNQPVRESIKAYGFRFAKRGHTLPSGKLAHWAHSCTAPLPFYRKHKGAPTTSSTSSAEPTTDDAKATAEALAFAGIA